MIAKVIVDITSSQVDKIFDYYFDAIDIHIGQRVEVPFGNRKIDGIVLDIADKSEVSSDKLKSIIRVFDDNLSLSNEMVKLVKYMSKYYNLRLADCIRLCIPTSFRNGKTKAKTIKYIALKKDVGIEIILKGLRKNAIKQKELLLLMQDFKKRLLSEINLKFGNSSVKSFINLGIFEIFEENVNRFENENTKIENKIKLNTSQQNAIKIVLDNKGYKKYLIHGVTGSGKTEVYLNIIENALKNNKTAIMLVPEIALTPQMLKVFTNRFGDRVGVLHSGLSLGEKFDEWQRIRNGEAKVVLGARSAIFAPLENIGAIIIDEEHDSSYFSETNPRYETVKISEFRAKYNECPLILGSATPSIESYYLATSGSDDCALIEMPNRINDNELPEIEIIDMCSELRAGNTSMFSRSLLSKLSKCLEKGEQAILFINRRGYNSFVRCYDCGYVPKCEACDVSLVYHKYDNELKCHFCNRRYQAVHICPSCGSKNLKYGAVGTQKVLDELQTLFPLVKILRLDNDTTTNKNSVDKILGEFSCTRPSILVGTQMIAKGHDFPFVTLVGIIDADISLHFNDYRAIERTFSLITQVSGRAGRKDLKGNVVLQTYTPKHYVYKMAINYDYKNFYQRELNTRKLTKFPPYAKIVRVLISGDNEKTAIDFTYNLLQEIKKLREQYVDDFVYLDAMKSPIRRMNNKYRYQIMIRLKNDNFDEILSKIYQCEKESRIKEIISFVEINPQNLS